LAGVKSRNNKKENKKEKEKEKRWTQWGGNGIK